MWYNIVIGVTMSCGMLRFDNHSEGFLVVYLGHVRFCKAYKDVKLTVASLVRAIGVVLTFYFTVISIAVQESPSGSSSLYFLNIRYRYNW